MDLFDRVETPQQIKEESFAFAELAEKSPDAFKTISEVSDMLGVPQHVLRFWESKFPQIKPMKRNGGRRYYRPQDVQTLTTIKHLLYKEGYTIKGARKAFNLKKSEQEQDITAALALEGVRVADDTGLFGEAVDAEHQDAINQMIASLTGVKRAELTAIRGELVELRQILSAAV